MLVLFVKIPTMQRLRKIRSFPADSNNLQITFRYSASYNSASHAL